MRVSAPISRRMTLSKLIPLAALLIIENGPQFLARCVLDRFEFRVHLVAELPKIITCLLEDLVHLFFLGISQAEILIHGITVLPVTLLLFLGIPWLLDVTCNFRCAADAGPVDVVQHSPRRDSHEENHKNENFSEYCSGD